MATNVPGSGLPEAERIAAPVTALLEADVTIVGAGPAGLAAASVLVENGLSVALFDDNPQPGGQYFKQLSAAFGGRPGPLQSERERAGALIGITGHRLVQYFPSTTVWAAPEPGIFGYAGEAASGRVRSRSTILAAGAHDKAVPFPGWTLPGVVTAGGALNLIKGQGLLPGRRVVVVGNGPLLLVSAYALIQADAQVLAVVEAGSPDAAALANAARLSAAPYLLAKGLRYRWAMLRAKTAYLPGHTIVEATGTSAVRSATIAPIGRDGVVDRQRARNFDVDAVIVGFGLSPSAEMTRMLGCAHRFDPLLGGWIPVRSPELETSEPTVYSVGDGAGIGGVEIAIAEGKLAARVIVRRLKGSGSAIPATAITDARARLERLYRFREGLNAMFGGPETYADLITPETVICRCEDLTAAVLTQSLRHNGGDLGQVKYATRISMGRCQGRNCLRTLSDMAGRPEPEPAALPGMRPPVRPIRIATLMNEPLAEARSPDMPFS